MTAAEGKQYAVGLRHAQVLALNSDGYPNATSTTGYEGVEIVGPKTFDVVTPDARRINHVGNDRVLCQDFLPPLEGASATLRASRNDFALHEVLSGNKEVTLGEAKVTGHGTDLQGSETDVCLLLFQQSKAATTKVRNWRSYILPSSNVVAKPSSMNDNPNESEFQCLPQIVTKYPWGVSFASGTEGFTEAQLLEGQTVDQPWICAWKADGTELEYLFPTGHTATATAKIHVVAKAGVAQTTGFTKYTTSIVFTTTPAANAMIVAFYEISAA